MDPKCACEARYGLKEKITNKDDYLLDEDFEDDMEEEEVAAAGGFVDDEKRKGVANGKKGGSSGGVSTASCQVERCGADLSEAKRYHRRHKVCELHAKAPAVVVSGLRQRFCQQCSRFHELSEFDEAKRSCRRRLAGHNERRRKGSAEPNGEGSSRKGVGTPTKESQCRQVDERGRVQMNFPGNPPYKRSQTR